MYAIKIKVKSVLSSLMFSFPNNKGKGSFSFQIVAPERIKLNLQVLDSLNT